MILFQSIIVFAVRKLVVKIQSKIIEKSLKTYNF